MMAKIQTQLDAKVKSKNIKPPNTARIATRGIIELIPSAAPRLVLSVLSVNHALNAASFAEEPKKVNHEMHEEYIEVQRGLIERIIAAGGAAVAVGTTSVRTLESLYFLGEKVSENPAIEESELCVGQWEPYNREHTLSTVEALTALLQWLDAKGLDRVHSHTRIMIAPGYTFRIVKAIVTNFHQPKSTLLLLVSAFIGGDWRRVYDYALENGFRFLSYGDSSLLIP